MSHDHSHLEPCDHSDGKHPVVTELTHHLPFSVGSVAIALVSLAIAQKVFGLRDPHTLEEIFHVCHPVHLLLSATATAAMFYLYDSRPVRAAVIGVLGSAPVCALGDIAFPWLGGRLMGQPMQFHICAIEEPWLVWPCVALGVVTGIAGANWVKRVTIYSHSAHVLVSSFASAIYLVGFGLGEWTGRFGWVLLILTVSVMVPCCLSDIVFPLMFAKRKPWRHPEVGEEEELLKRRH